MKKVLIAAVVAATVLGTASLSLAGGDQNQNRHSERHCKEWGGTKLAAEQAGKVVRSQKRERKRNGSCSATATQTRDRKRDQKRDGSCQE